MDENRADELTEMVGRAAEGDREAWNWIVDHHSRLVWSVVRRFRLGDHQSADVVQTTWLRLVEHLSAIRDPCRLPGWLATTARNLSIEASRQAKQLQPLDDDCELPSVAEQPESVVLRREQAELVRDALERLSERDRQLLKAVSSIPPMPYEEISRRFGMPIGSIGPTRMRALKRLRAELQTSGLVDAAAS